MLLHPWFYPYLAVASLAAVLMLILIPRAYYGLRRDLAEHRAFKDVKRADRALDAKLRILIDTHHADMGPIA